MDGNQVISDFTPRMTPLCLKLTVTKVRFVPIAVIRKFSPNRTFSTKATIKGNRKPGQRRSAAWVRLPS
jgi:hypothetical protein